MIAYPIAGALFIASGAKAITTLTDVVLPGLQNLIYRGKSVSQKCNCENLVKLVDTIAQTFFSIVAAVSMTLALGTAGKMVYTWGAKVSLTAACSKAVAAATPFILTACLASATYTTLRGRIGFFG